VFASFLQLVYKTVVNMQEYLRNYKLENFENASMVYKYIMKLRKAAIRIKRLLKKICKLAHCACSALRYDIINKDLFHNIMTILLLNIGKYENMRSECFKLRDDVRIRIMVYDDWYTIRNEKDFYFDNVNLIRLTNRLKSKMNKFGSLSTIRYSFHQLKYEYSPKLSRKDRDSQLRQMLLLSKKCFDNHKIVKNTIFGLFDDEKSMVQSLKQKLV
jgi:hypothetical protein